MSAGLDIYLPICMSDHIYACVCVCVMTKHACVRVAAYVSVF